MCLIQNGHHLHTSISLLFSYRIVDGKYNGLDIVHHIVIPKANDFITLGIQKCGSFSVTILLLKMLTPIQFDNKFILD